MKILVVHRQNEIVAVIKSVLGGYQPVVRHVESGLDGLLTSRIEHFDLIISGTDLPVVTGFELVRSIKTHSVNRHTTVVLVTETREDKTEMLSNALGVTKVITRNDLSMVLPEVVLLHVKSEPDKEWNSFAKPRQIL